MREVEGRGHFILLNYLTCLDGALSVVGLTQSKPSDATAHHCVTLSGLAKLKLFQGT